MHARKYTVTSTLSSNLQLRLDLLFPSLQARMLCDDWPGDSEEGSSARFARELGLGSNMEESKVACDKVMCDTSCLVEDVNLAVENIFGLLVCVLGNVAGGSCLDPVET